MEVAETAAMERGTAVHAMALGTRRVVAYPGKQRRGAEWEAFEAANADAEILTEAAYETARAMADSLLAHPVFAAGLADARRRGGVEHTIFWKHLGVPCRSTPDLWTPDWVADVKTARTSDPREWEFPRAAIRAHYHAQLAWYAEALRSTKLAPALRYHYIFAVEATPPYVVTVFRLTSAGDVDRNGRPGALEDGDKAWRRWFEALRVCLDADEWPAYSAVTCEIDVPDEMPALTFGAGDDGDEREEIAA